MCIYPDSATSSCSPALFQQPDVRYCGTPFWSWNCQLEPGRLFDRIEEFKPMGLLAQP